MSLDYSSSTFYDPSSDVYAFGLQSLLVNDAAPIYAEVAAETNRALPPLSSGSIFVGGVNRADPKLLTISHEFSSHPEAQFGAKILTLTIVIRAGAEDTPAMQSSRSAGYIAVIERLFYAMVTANKLKLLIDAWPAQLNGESDSDYAGRKKNYQKHVAMELVSIDGIPSNEAIRSLSGYEGGARIKLSILAIMR